MLRVFIAIVSCALFLLLSGCLMPQQQVKFQSDIQSLDKRLRNLEQHPNQKASTNQGNQQLNNIGRQQANLKAELESLRVELQNLTGRFEDQQHSMKQLRNELTLAQNDLSLKVAELEPQQTTPTKEPDVHTPQSPLVGNGVSATIPTKQATKQQTAVPTPPLTANQTDNQSAAGADALYQQALQLVQQKGDFSQSRQLFKKFMQQYPAHKLAINAMYWIGETYYGDKKYESAILQFQDVIQKHPQHPKVPAALMKQGLAFYALGDVRNARVILQKVIDSYPATPEADKAQQRLSSWQ